MIWLSAVLVSQRRREHGGGATGRGTWQGNRREGEEGIGVKGSGMGGRLAGVPARGWCRSMPHNYTPTRTVGGVPLYYSMNNCFEQ